ncbi:CPK1, partial [Symbiodinium necroappetens]
PGVSMDSGDSHTLRKAQALAICAKAGDEASGRLLIGPASHGKYRTCDDCNVEQPLKNVLADLACSLRRVGSEHGLVVVVTNHMTT